MLTLWQQCRPLCSAPPRSHGCNSPITGQITAVVQPGSGWKWQRDQLCVESQPFFVFPAKKSGGCRSHAGLKLTHSYLVTRSRVQQFEVITAVFQTTGANRYQKQQVMKPAIQLAAWGKKDGYFSIQRYKNKTKGCLFLSQMLNIEKKNC